MRCPLAALYRPGRRRSRRRQAANVRPAATRIFSTICPTVRCCPRPNRVVAWRQNPMHPVPAPDRDLRRPVRSRWRSSPPASGADASAVEVKPIHLGHFDIERNDIGVAFADHLARDQGVIGRPDALHVALTVDDFRKQARTNAESSTTMTRIFSNHTSEQINGSTGSGLRHRSRIAAALFDRQRFRMEWARRLTSALPVTREEADFAGWMSRTSCETTGIRSVAR